MEQVEEEGLASVAEVDRLQRKHPSYIQTSAASSSTTLPPSSAALPPSSPLAPPGALFLVLAEPTIFYPNVIDTYPGCPKNMDNSKHIWSLLQDGLVVPSGNGL